MSNIRYVCLSDMHLGEEDSLLTNLKTSSTETDPTSPSPVMEQLVECLRHLITDNENDGKPTLILCGDILEMALTTTNEAAMVFERFIELIMSEGKELFGGIIYVPGNHCHHLWESARETQYVNYVVKEVKPKDELPIPWHTTNMYVEEEADRVPSYFLTKLVQRHTHLKDFRITVAYPNFGLFKQNDKRSVIFHHGHYIESLYYLMSTLRTLIFSNRKKPEHVWDIEAENFAWIDFFWSAMGRSGEVGQDVELIYEKMQDKEQFKKLLHNLADNLAEKYDLPGWGDLMEAKILKWIINAAVDKVMGSERVQTDKDLSDKAEKGLRTYVSGPLRKQILTERKKEENMPSSVTFIFGHTHKPLQRDMNFRGDPQPLHGGAVALVDENLNTTSIRVYNESSDPEGYSVKVEEASHTSEKPNLFHERIKKLVESSEKRWKGLSNTIARTVYIREQHLRARISEKP
jgi:hypothetical protein